MNGTLTGAWPGLLDRSGCATTRNADAPRRELRERHASLADDGDLAAGAPRRPRGGSAQGSARTPASRASTTSAHPPSTPRHRRPCRAAGTPPRARIRLRLAGQRQVRVVGLKPGHVESESGVAGNALPAGDEVGALEQDRARLRLVGGREPLLRIRVGRERERRDGEAENGQGRRKRRTPLSVERGCRNVYPPSGS